MRAAHEAGWRVRGHKGFEAPVRKEVALRFQAHSLAEKAVNHHQKIVGSLSRCHGAKREHARRQNLIVIDVPLGLTLLFGLGLVGETTGRDPVIAGQAAPVGAWQDPMPPKPMMTIFRPKIRAWRSYLSGV